MPSEQGRHLRGTVTRRAFLRRAARSSLVGGLLGVGGVLGLGALLAACQTPTSPPKPSDATPVPPRPTPRPTNTPAGPAAEVKPALLATPPLGPPKPGGALVWTTDPDADPLDLDPHTAASTGGAAVWADLVYQSLVMFDAGQRLTPALAEAWAMTSPTTWTFTLRQGVRFHDGSELEAEDVRGWFERLRAPATASPYAGWYGQVEKVEPRGRYEVTFTLGAPYAPLLATLASLRGSAIAPRRWLARGTSATKLAAVGSGPFRIREYVPGSHVTYEKHTAYWERELPYLDAVTLRFQPDEAARLTDTLTRAPGASGQPAPAAGLGPLSAATATRLKTERTLTVLSAPGARQTATFMNTRRAPFDDVRVRQAVALAADRPAALARVLGGEGALTGPIPTDHGSWGRPPDSLPGRPDLARARRLLEEAGHPEGFEAAMRVGVENAQVLAVSQLLSEQLREIGVALRVEPLAADAFAAAVAARDYDLCTVHVGFLPDPDAYCSLLYHTNGGQNLAGWSSRAFDDLVNDARTVMDPGQRKARYDEAAALLLEEAPAVWWFAANTLEAVSSEVKGYTPSFSGRRAALKTAWLAR
jgi:peptide/nickel transport system substrate-binding protein